jgi:hypothetical protein
MYIVVLQFHRHRDSAMSDISEQRVDFAHSVAIEPFSSNE